MYVYTYTVINCAKQFWKQKKIVILAKINEIEPDFTYTSFMYWQEFRACATRLNGSSSLTGIIF